MATIEKAKKNQAAVALGRLGGLKGGKASALKLTADEPTESASRPKLRTEQIHLQ